jgi:DNA-binding transcriptional ArsR family regulator
MVEYNRGGRSVDKLSMVFSALADPTRRAILARLADGEATVNQLAEPFPISLQAVSKHLKVLEQAGLITRGKDAQWRPCRLEAAPLREIAQWTERYRQFWDERYERLDTYLQELQGPAPHSTAQARHDQESGEVR